MPELERRVEDLKARLPAHSIPPTMLADLDDLDAQLAAARLELVDVLRRLKQAGIERP